MSTLRKASIMAGIVFAAVALFVAAAASVGSSAEKPSRIERLGSGQVHAYSSKVLVDLPNATKIVFAGTNSMLPCIREGAVGLEVAPKSPEEILVGDVVSYESEQAGAAVIHEVIETGTDSEGWYARTKGYNARKADPEKVRFWQVKGVLSALFW